MGNSISKEDIVRLAADPSPQNRAETADKIAMQFSQGALAEAEAKIAADIFQIMVRDTEESVRQALATHLKNVSGLSRDLSLKLAHDESDAVALPFIKASDVLTDADLISIIQDSPAERQTAVAQRSTVSEEVSHIIVDCGAPEAVISLVSNQNADISDTDLVKAVDKHGDVEALHKPMVERETLPLAAKERLVAKISNDLKAYLVSHHDLPEDMAADIMIQSRERTTVGLLNTNVTESDLFELVRQLYRTNRLTPSLILRSLCIGDVSLFEVAVSVLSGVPITNVRLLIHDEGSLGFKSLYQKAGLPAPLFTAFRSAVDMNIHAEFERTDDTPEQLMRRMLERILTEQEEMAEEYGIDNVEYLLARFNQLEKPSEKNT